MAPHPLLARQFGEWLRAERKRAKMSISQVARKLEVPEGTVSRWERGIALPRWSHIIRIQTRLGWEAPVRSFDTTGV